MIVNADDFGLSAGVSEGIIEAHERGIVTSTSLMVRWPAAIDAARYGRENPELSLGLHIDLAEWAYRDRAWSTLYEVVPVHDQLAVTEEISAQLATFRRLVGRDPTHLDSHQHVHLREPARTAMIEVAHQLGIPLRHLGTETSYCGDFYGQTSDGQHIPGAIAVERLLAILSSLSENIIELACHPGYADELDTMYKAERRNELATLCDPRVRTAILALNIQLCSFRDLVSRNQLASP